MDVHDLARAYHEPTDDPTYEWSRIANAYWAASIVFRKMLDEIESLRASLPPEVRSKLEADEREAQRQSLVRAISTPCEHGVRDFEDCGDCRKAQP
jgi:hypothetical protein